MRILIVEDDYTSCLLLKKYLTKYGACEMATNGIEALDVFLKAHKENEPFGLICLDIMMPKLDGFSVLKAIREFEKQKSITVDHYAKIIMTTALNDLQTVNKVNEAGCEGFVWKPIELTRFNQVLVKLGIEKLA